MVVPVCCAAQENINIKLAAAVHLVLCSFVRLFGVLRVLKIEQEMLAGC